MYPSEDEVAEVRAATASWVARKFELFTQGFFRGLGLAAAAIVVVQCLRWIGVLA